MDDVFYIPHHLEVDGPVLLDLLEVDGTITLDLPEEDNFYWNSFNHP